MMILVFVLFGVVLLFFGSVLMWVNLTETHNMLVSVIAGTMWGNGFFLAVVLPILTALLT